MKKSLLAIVMLGAIAATVWFSTTTMTPVIKTVGVIMYRPTNLPTLEGFKEGMKEHGLIEGETVRYVFNGPTMALASLDADMQLLLNEKPDLIFACTTPAALAAKKATQGSALPVIFAPVNDPVATGILSTIQRPEGNITGIRLAETDGMRLQSLVEVVPSIKRVFVPYNPEDKSALASLARLEEAAPKVGVELVAKEFNRNVDLSPDSTYVPSDIDAILMPREGLVMSFNKEFVALCNSRKLPLSVARFLLVQQGALTGYCFNGFEIGKQAARMALIVMAGTPIYSIPVETAQDYLFINLATAERIHLAISEATLRRAHTILH